MHQCRFFYIPYKFGDFAYFVVFNSVVELSKWLAINLLINLLGPPRLTMIIKLISLSIRQVCLLTSLINFCKSSDCYIKAKQYVTRSARLGLYFAI